MVPFLCKKRLKQNTGKKFLKWMFLPSELERGTKALQFDVCCKAIDQKFDCGCNSYAIFAFGLTTLRLYVFLDSHPRLTAGLRGCAYYYQHLSGLAVPPACLPHSAVIAIHQLKHRP